MKHFGTYWRYIEKQNKRTVLAYSLSAFGILLFIAIVITFPFKDRLYNTLFPKQAVVAVAIAPTQIQIATAHVDSANTIISSPWSLATTNGNFLMALLSVNSLSPVTIASAPNGWTKITEKASGNIYQWIYYYGNATSQSGDVSFTLSTSAKAVLNLVEYKDVEQVNPFDTQTTATGSGSTSSNTITQSSPDEFIISALSADNSLTIGSPSGSFTLSNQATTTGDASESNITGAMMHAFFSSTNPVTGSFPLSSSANWIQTSLAFKAAQVPLTPTPTSAPVVSTDWPQLQRDSARTGFTAVNFNIQNVRPRWIWFGSNWILRNRLSETLPTWDDDLTSRDGYSLSMPTSVPFSFAESMQPIIVNNKLFVGDLEAQKVYALNLFDGTTLWEASNPGGTAWPGVATSTTVVFTSLYGYVTAWNTTTGQQLWQVDTGKTISHSPALDGSTIYVANQNGKVYAINITNGAILWQTDTEAPIQGGVAVSQGKVYVGNEELYAIGLNASNGQEFGRTKLVGQSFRRIWPVVTQGRVIYQTVQLPFVGSEYVMNGVITSSGTSFASEQTTVRNWLQGSGWMYEDLFALDTTDMSKNYVVSNGVVGGVGHHADPPVIMSDGRALTYWPTYFGTVMSCSFGCPAGYEIDLATIDFSNGNGVQLRNSGTPASSVETDNTFGMTMANSVLFLRQSFRGTKALHLGTYTSYNVSAIYRYNDCGGWQAPLNYANGSPGCPPTGGDGINPPSTDVNFDGHVGPAIIPGYVCFTEGFAITCMED